MIAEDEPGKFTLGVVPQDDGFYVVVTYGGRLRAQGTVAHGPYSTPGAARTALERYADELRSEHQGDDTRVIVAA